MTEDLHSNPEIVEILRKLRSASSLESNDAISIVEQTIIAMGYDKPTAQDAAKKFIQGEGAN